MISIILSERDFDYEIQALVSSFFPGIHVNVFTTDNLEEAGDKLDSSFIVIRISLQGKYVETDITCGEHRVLASASVSGDDDWHKHAGKTAHPYRTYYKNILKKLIFQQISRFPEKKLPDGLNRRIPAWGTMTGVRPTKIAMNEILSGKSPEQVRKELRETYCCSEEKAELGMQIASREAEILKAADFENGYSLYIGIPFCPTTCLYCSFTSYPFEKFGNLAEDYLVALKKEISYVSEQAKGRKLTSIYIGGGTPTTLTAPQLDELISFVRECFPVDEGSRTGKYSYEFTVEAGRPDSITEEKLKVLRKHGVDRISVNPQTMQQKTLELIGRKHTVLQTKEAFKMARELGFTNINMDLIIGLPGETVEEFEDTLARIEELNPDSVTIHSLVVKRASRLRSTLEECDELYDDEKPLRMEKMLQIGEKFAVRNGYLPYYMYRQKNSAGHAGSTGQENIGYARPGKECIYNILIMEEKQTILAVGAGASTKIYHRELGQVSRIENVKSINDYIDRIDEMIERKDGKLFEND